MSSIPPRRRDLVLAAGDEVPPHLDPLAERLAADQQRTGRAGGRVQAHRLDAGRDQAEPAGLHHRAAD